jgi:hypothetical protein
VRRQLINTQIALSKAELKIGELRKQSESQSKVQDELFQWKVHKNKLFSDLQTKTKQLER